MNEFILELKPSSKTIYLHDTVDMVIWPIKIGIRGRTAVRSKTLSDTSSSSPISSICYPNMNPNSLFRRLLDSSI